MNKRRVYHEYILCRVGFKSRQYFLPTRFRAALGASFTADVVSAFVEALEPAFSTDLGAAWLPLLTL